MERMLRAQRKSNQRKLLENREELYEQKANMKKICRDENKLNFLHLPREIRDIIYEYVLGGETLQVNSSARILLPTQNFLGLQTVCRKISNETKAEIMFSWNTFRAEDPRILRAWIGRLTSSQRSAIKFVELDNGHFWNCICSNHGYSMVSSPVGRCPPSWFTAAELSLKTVLSQLVRLHLRVKFEAGYLVGFVIPERRAFLIEEARRAVEAWRRELGSWNPGVTVQASCKLGKFGPSAQRSHEEP